MLFGQKEFQEKILADANAVAQQKNFKLVYGAVLGSISRGVPGYDSDYDIRFLYIRNDFPQKWINPEECREDDIVYRYILDSDTTKGLSIKNTYDRIAFWELTSFIQFLSSPRIGNETKDSSNLYYVAEHTFLTPYSWDPYGIQSSTANYIYRNHKPLYCIETYSKTIEGKYVWNSDHISIHGYIKSIWAALSIDWIITKKGPAPVNFWLLLAQIDDPELYHKIDSLYLSRVDMTEEYISITKDPIRKETKNKVQVKKDSYIDKYIITRYQMAQQFLKTSTLSFDIQQEKKELNGLRSAIIKLIDRPRVEGISLGGDRWDMNF